MNVIEARSTYRSRTLGEQLTFQCEVNRILLATTRPRSATRDGMLSKLEMQEMDAACREGVAPEAFAARLQERDRDRKADEPINHPFPKPLSIEHATIIRLLTEKYVGIEQSIQRWEDDDNVWLRLPRIKRVFAEAT